MSREKEYVLKPGYTHYEGRKLLKAGAVVTMSEERYQGLRDRFRPVVVAEDPAAGDWDILPHRTVPQVVKLIQEIDDEEQLVALLEAEQGGKNRDGVVTAVTKRMEALQDEDEEDEEGEE